MPPGHRVCESGRSLAWHGRQDAAIGMERVEPWVVYSGRVLCFVDQDSGLLGIEEWDPGGETLGIAQGTRGETRTYTPFEFWPGGSLVLVRTEPRREQVDYDPPQPRPWKPP